MGTYKEAFRKLVNGFERENSITYTFYDFSNKKFERNAQSRICHVSFKDECDYNRDALLMVFTIGNNVGRTVIQSEGSSTANPSSTYPQKIEALRLAKENNWKYIAVAVSAEDFDNETIRDYVVSIESTSYGKATVCVIDDCIEALEKNNKPDFYRCRKKAGRDEYTLAFIKKDNKLLKEENRKLRTLKDKYDALLVENKLLSDLLNYVPLPETAFVSARVVAEENDAFAHSLVAYVGDNNVVKGDVVLSDLGVVGRVDRVANRYAKIILITDINSNVPVIVEGTRMRGILSGDNTNMPKLMFVPLDAEINVGDKIVTSGVSGVFPAGLPVGHVVGVSKYEIKVKPMAAMEKLEYVKIVKYGLEGVLPQEEEPANE